MCLKERCAIAAPALPMLHAHSASGMPLQCAQAAVFASFDNDGSGQLSVDEVRPMEHTSAASTDSAAIPTASSATKSCPPSMQLQRALKILGLEMSGPETELLMREIDSSGNGEISYEEVSSRLWRLASLGNVLLPALQCRTTMLPDIFLSFCSSSNMS